LVDGIATYNTPLHGDINFQALYNGDSDSQASLSSVIPQEVNASPTTTTLTISDPESPLGGSLTLTAQVSSTTEVPLVATEDDYVTFFAGSVSIASARVQANGVATVTINNYPLGAGTHTISAQYGNYWSSSHLPSTSDTQIYTITTGSGVEAVITLESSQNPSYRQQDVTFTATVEGTAGTPTGTVTFMRASGNSFYPIVTVGLTAGKATHTMSFGAQDRIRALYNGDGTYKLGESNIITQAVEISPTTTSLQISQPDTSLGSQVTFTATVASNTAVPLPPYNAEWPDGYVTFYDGGSGIGGAPVGPGGVATFSTTALGLGPHFISARYQSNYSSNHATSSSQEQTIFVNRGLVPATMDVSLSSNSSHYGENVTISVTVSGQDGVPTGKVVFRNGTTLLGSADLNEGKAELPVDWLQPGPTVIHAVYEGDTVFAGAEASKSHTVNRIPVTVTVTSNTPSMVGDSYYVSVNVAGTSTSSAYATGTLTINDGHGNSCTTFVYASGGCSISGTPEGTATLTATYAGDTYFEGGTGTATHTVRAPDTENPVVTPPADVTVSNDAGQAGAVVTYPAATVTDDSGETITPTYSQASNTFFPLGATTVTVTAKDSVGNEGTATFSVTVNDTEAPVIGTPSDFNVSNDAGMAGAVVTFAATVSDNSQETITPTYSHASGTLFPIGETTVTVTAKDSAGNEASKTFKVTVTDTEAPVITPPANVTVVAATGEATAVVTYADATVTDNSGEAITPTYSQASGTSFPLGTTTVSVNAQDSAGNPAGTVTFTVTVNDADAPIITPPANITVQNDDGMSGAAVTYPPATVSDNSGETITPTYSHASGTVFPLGTTTVTITAEDSGGNSASASFTVTVVDETAPVITAPANVTVSADAGADGAVVTYAPATVTDNSGETITPAYSQASGTSFPVGATTVTITAEDSSGNQASASFTVTVEDDEAPVITVPDDIVVSNDPGQAGAVVTYAAATVTDNSDDCITPGYSKASGTFFPLGATTVTVTAEDSAGNVTTESFTVTVNDDEAPAFAGFPNDIALTVDYPDSSAVASWTEPTATDNAPGASVSRVGGPASGSSFPLGSTQVSYEARDAAGNVLTRSFTVTVVQEEPGQVTFTVSSPADTTVTFNSPEPTFNFAVPAGGPSVSRSVSIRPGSYGFAFSASDGVGIAQASCSAGGSVNALSRTGSVEVVSGGQITCTFTAVDSLGVTAGLIGDFLKSRAALILQNGPDVSRRLERLTGRYTNAGGATAMGFGFASGALPFSLQIGEKQTQFAYSLRRSQAEGGKARLVAASPHENDDRGLSGNADDSSLAERMGLGRTQEASGYSGASSTLLGYDKTSAFASGAARNRNAAGTETVDPMQNRFDIWVEGTLARFDSQGGDGTFGIIHAGMDYLLTPDVLAGIGVQVDWADQDGANASEIGGTGYMVGPYLTARLSPQFYVDARAAWGQSFNQVKPFGTYEDKFDTDRWLATAALIGDFSVDTWKIRPELRLSWFKETSESYVDTLNVAIPSIDVETGTLEFGPTFSTALTLGEFLSFEPYVTIEGIWTFMQKNTATSFTEQPGLEDEGLRGRIEVGADLAHANGASLSGSLFYDGIGASDFSAWGGRLRIGKQF
jgi:hypothetical protein